MINDSIHVLLRERLLEHSSSAPEDDKAFFWVDWREDDDQVPGLCEAVLHTGQLSAEWAEDTLMILWRGQRTPVPLRKTLAYRLSESFLLGAVVAVLPSLFGVVLPWLTRENRQVTLRTLNRALQPDYEIRQVLDSGDSEGPAYVPLPREDWLALEEQYGRSSLAAVFQALPPP